MVACSNRPCACLAGGSDGIVTVELVERNESDEECEDNTCAAQRSAANTGKQIELGYLNDGEHTRFRLHQT